ncbi:MAG: selenocysteine-specific translation elongation factor [Desulfobacterales bacterium]|nr:selenocysteine-specific translation elongation factor [Desulfobacterales bacterium]MDD3082290.1 selenocysteine-specific translation elongation factor [Desulfobacterales bacterium]MDD3951409.1 selenocysteine-specific translation elongation factor [Desulfobacterales bacterium]MDD4463926.1 selenocysteine-specific translation elongation factor [Desulfobacterales bacterium]MDY0377197.1 selenocysteine-specific translation elongation factor [Desulfobacterales bacterium]
MKQIILGTAGHIDHGKTSLVRAVTGIDTDRLKEEKLRGITIELGFASLDLPEGRHVGIVDVPGHEKFVKHMVAGATGIDIVVMVIAADEGIMPQTREHMEICSLLGIQYGFVALTKIDMVEPEWLDLVTEEVRDFTQGTFLEGAPIVPVSSITGEGIADFIKALDALCRKVPDRSNSGIFRLPVDRVFTMRGFGTVITGTLISGCIRTGDPVMIYPSKITSKVRGIQAHNQTVEQAASGMRTAINFQGLEKAVINRGDVLSTPESLFPSFMVDILLEYLPGNPKVLKNRTRVRFHSGTSEILGNVILLNADELQPGQSAPAQIRLDAPITVVKDDRFVIRSYSPVRTIGGGRVINPIPAKHKRFQPDVVEGLKHLLEADFESVVAYQTETCGVKGVSFNELRIMTNLPEKRLQQMLHGLLSRQALIQVEKDPPTYIHRRAYDQLKQDALGCLEAYHEANPLKAGMSKEELKSKLPPFLGPKLYNLLLGQTSKEGAIVAEEDLIRLAAHRISLEEDQADIRNRILDAYRKSGLQPPYFNDLCDQMNISENRAKEVLMLLVKEGTIVKIKEDLYFDAGAVDALKEKLVSFLTENGEIATPQFKEMTGVSRKFVIPLIEYFDSKNVTIRIGDIRKLRNR